MPSANALVRRASFARVVCERLPDRTPPPRDLSWVRAKPAARLPSRTRDDALDRERHALSRVFGPLADPLTDPPPIDYIAHRDWTHAAAILEAARPDVIVVYG